MTWQGEFHFDTYWAAYRGRSHDNSLHAHAALQLCLAGDEGARLVDEREQITRGQSLLVKPGVKHQLLPCSQVTLIFLEPQSSLSRLLLEGVQGSIVPLEPEHASLLGTTTPLAEVLNKLLQKTGTPQTTVDERLLKALEYFRTGVSEPNLMAAAQSVGISASRLRALAKDQLGVPLKKLLAWHQLSLAAKALSQGEALAEAAYIAGYADQAHFSREMRKIIGLTPGEARRPLS